MDTCRGSADSSRDDVLAELPSIAALNSKSAKSPSPTVRCPFGIWNRREVGASLPHGGRRRVERYGTMVLCILTLRNCYVMHTTMRTIKRRRWASDARKKNNKYTDQDDTKHPLSLPVPPATEDTVFVNSTPPAIAPAAGSTRTDWQCRRCSPRTSGGRISRAASPSDPASPR